MKIPKKVKVGPYIYKVTYHKKLHDEQGQVLWGQALYQKQLIQIQKNMSRDRQNVVFLHEALHAIVELIGQQLPEDTHIALSAALYTFLRDNDFLKRREDQ